MSFCGDPAFGAGGLSPRSAVRARVGSGTSVRFRGTGLGVAGGGGGACTPKAGFDPPGWLAAAR